MLNMQVRNDDINGTKKKRARLTNTKSPKKRWDAEGLLNSGNVKLKQECSDDVQIPHKPHSGLSKQMPG